MTFKVGDSVKCIDNRGFGEENLVVGQTYKIKAISEPNFISLEGVCSNWFPHRFELAETPTSSEMFMVTNLKFEPVSAPYPLPFLTRKEAEEFAVDQAERFNTRMYVVTVISEALPSKATLTKLDGDYAKP